MFNQQKACSVNYFDNICNPHALDRVLHAIDLDADAACLPVK